MDQILVESPRQAAAPRPSFDYGVLPDDAADLAQQASARIKGRVRNSIIETGRDLLEVKKGLGHGHFTRWLAAEFGMTARTAEHYMSVAAFLDGKSENFADLPRSTLYALAAPMAPGHVIEEVAAAAAAGAMLSAKEIQDKLAEATAGRRRKGKAKMVPEQSPEAQPHPPETMAPGQAAAEFLNTRLSSDDVAALARLMKGVSWSKVEALLLPISPPKAGS